MLDGAGDPSANAAPSGCTRVLATVPVRSMPVEPCRNVRAPSGKLSGGSGMLWPEFGEGGD